MRKTAIVTVVAALVATGVCWCLQRWFIGNAYGPAGCVPTLGGHPIPRLLGDAIWVAAAAAPWIILIGAIVLGVILLDALSERQAAASREPG